MRIFNWFGTRGPRQSTGLQSGEAVQTGTTAVTFETAMTVSAFWACVRLLAETIASMPLRCYKLDKEGGRTVTQNYKVWRLLKFMPNRYQTSVEFFESVVVQLAATGNFYGAIEWDVTDEYPVSIIPLMSAQMQPELLADGSLAYVYYDAAGSTRVYSDRSIWHVKLFGNGLVGLSPLSHAARSIGVAYNSDRRTDKLANSGGKTNGILMVDGKLTPDQRAAIRRNFAELTEGSSDQLFVLEANMKYERTSLSPQDMQLLETRRFQVEDIARFMGVPSVLINDTSGTTAWGSGIHQIITGFFKLGIYPYLNRIQTSATRHLMPVKDWEKFELEFDFDSLLQADFATRMDSYNKGINGGIMAPNEARRRERLPPKDGGDTIYLNGTLVSAGTRPNAAQTVSDQRDPSQV